MCMGGIDFTLIKTFVKNDSTFIKYLAENKFFSYKRKSIFNLDDIDDESYKKIAKCLENPNRSNGLNRSSKTALRRLMQIRERYFSLCKRFDDLKQGNEEIEDFNAFLRWLNSCPRKGNSNDNALICAYCGTSEKEYWEIFKIAKERETGPSKGQLGYSKKNSFNSGYLEVDKKDPNKNYTFDSNCVLCCHLCNNAKSDLISNEDFQPIAEGIKKYIKSLLK